jgi:hypothetical protein
MKNAIADGIKSDKLKKLVYEALDHCKANDYMDILGGTPQEIAGDLIAYDDDLPPTTEAELVPHIEAWKTERGA